MKKKREPEFTSEAEMCAAFIRTVKGIWKVYPETAGWDLLCVKPDDGVQVGIQAKLLLNAKVICQAVEDNPVWYSSHGPDYRAVLIPGGVNADLEKVCDYLGLTVIRQWKHGISNHLPEMRFSSGWHEMFPLQRHNLPEYMPDVAAGVKSPIQLTDWKVKALKLCMLLEHRGYLTRADFKRHGVDCRRWIVSWLQPGEHGFVRADGMPDFKSQHPQVWEQIKADPSKWLPQ